MEKTIIVGITILSFFMRTPATSGANPPAPQTSIKQIQSFHPCQLKRKTIILAQTEPQTAETGDQQPKDNAKQAPVSGKTTTENSNDNSKNTERKSLRPFRPSEKIAAEQAVDFPVDI